MGDILHTHGAKIRHTALSCSFALLGGMYITLCCSTDYYAHYVEIQ